MARTARLVAPNFPHHIVQRGNRRQAVFFRDADYEEYLKLLREHLYRYDVTIAAYCLMPNHIHLIAIPAKGGNLARAIGETHRKYTRMINFRERWRGYLWQGRFGSYVLDESHLLAATRYILRNPVKANIVKEPWDYKWSSAKHHIRRGLSMLVHDNIYSALVSDWKTFLQNDADNIAIKALRMHERTGRPLGDEEFIDKLETIMGISIRKKRPGPKIGAEAIDN